MFFVVVWEYCVCSVLGVLLVNKSCGCGWFVVRLSWVLSVVGFGVVGLLFLV